MIGMEFTSLLRGTVIAGLLLTGIPVGVSAETATIEATADATLIEDDLGLLANGSGPALFIGRTGQANGGIRRAAVRFDLSETLPAKAIIERVFLNLRLTPSNEQSTRVTVHRLLQGWSEGSAFSSGGAGAPSNYGDTTWLHTHYDYQFWAIAGGHYVKRVSAEAWVGPEDFYTWQSSPPLVADVRSWQHAPHRNFGWLMIGGEENAQSVKRFNSRESSVAEFRPTLTIEYRMPENQRN